MYNRTLSALALSFVAAALTACGNVAGASTPLPPPELPAPPPLTDEAAARLAEPAPEVPAAPLSPAPQDVALLSESFDGGLDGWAAEDFSQGPGGPATWRAEGGAAVQAGNDLGMPDPGGTYLVAGDPAWDDYAVSAVAFAQSPTELGLVARKSASGYYQARLVADSDASALILELVDDQGITRELARSDAPGSVGRWLTLRLEVRGSTISADLDGVAAVSAEDGSLGSGQVALYATADAGARFDSVVVSR